METSVGDRDVRWEQRFENYRKALAQLRNAVLLSRQRKLSELEAQGILRIVRTI